ncbi:GAF domain-containing protein [Tolypothrix sp. VBCCA 56010]|uniref:GAF domain-containing protein n=1 Tax=Tolypothrix sp. VBCCA 56010 TaxID=3137731 RepID=UPI003D7CC6F4
MTNLFPENKENGHHAVDAKNLENNNASNNIDNNQILVELNVVEQHFKSWRRQLQDMATQIRQASDQDTLVKITTAQVREKIACDRAVAKIIDKIRQSPDIEAIFTTSTKEVRSLLNTDRVAVYRFNPDWSGEFISESVTVGWSNLVEKQYKILR